jgi:uncharacterized Zn finger protein (UPF0148 family)
MAKGKKLWGREEVATCKLCGTQLKDGDLTCPLCGFLTGADANVFVIPGNAGGHAKQKEIRPTPTPPPAKEEAVPDVKEAAPPEMEPELDLEEEMAAAMQKKPEASTPAFSLDAPGLRKLLAKQPDLLEPGLQLVADKKGKPIGAGLSTAVGDIDLLARDASGAFVVVTIAGRGQPGEKFVAEILQRIGWVRKHLGKGKERVRGIVVVEQVPEDLGYASAAVADTVVIKTYRVGLAIEDVEI